MDNHELDIRKGPEKALVVKADNGKSVAVVKYEKVDAVRYSFFCSFDEEIEFRMDETDQNAEHTEYVDSEYVESVPESDKAYYAAAAACGILTGFLSTVQLTEEQLKKFSEFKEKQWEPIIVKAAHLAGCKKKDYKSAAKYLFDRCVRKMAKDEKIKECFTVLAGHPSLCGLCFSVITQYCGKAIALGENGKIGMHKLPDYYVIGETDGEKLLCGIFYWLLNLAADEAESKHRVIDELPIANDLRRIIRKFAAILLKTDTSDFAAIEKKFSEWLEKMLAQARQYAQGGDEGEGGSPLFAVMGEVLDLADDAFLVLLNDGLVRCAYMLLRVCEIAAERRMTTIEELYAVPAAEFLPAEGRLLSRMCLIASSLFVGVNVAGAVIKGLKGKIVKGRNFRETFLGVLNIPGIGRFLFACAEDSRYWGRDIRILFERNADEEAGAGSTVEEDTGEDTFRPFVLDALQARILYSLEALAVQFDISNTPKAEDAQKKREWLEAWKQKMVTVSGADLDADQYFVEDEDILYDGIYHLAGDRSNWGWFYLLTEELALFEPYRGIGTEKEQKEFSKLNMKADYLREQFIRRQTIVTQSEADAIEKKYREYTGYIDGTAQGMLRGAGIAVAAAFAAGGAALVFAPQIAVVIAGDAVRNLAGAALTKASLAFVGGGSLAAGGLGMAGGTAIITGGGALAGAVTTGAVSTASVILQMPKDYWVRQGAKMLTYCSCVLLDCLKDADAVSGTLKWITWTIGDVEEKLNAIKEEKNDLDRELIRKTEEYLRCLKKCRAELQRLMKQAS